MELAILLLFEGRGMCYGVHVTDDFTNRQVQLRVQGFNISL